MLAHLLIHSAGKVRYCSTTDSSCLCVLDILQAEPVSGLHLNVVIDASIAVLALTIISAYLHVVQEVIFMIFMTISCI